MDREIVLEPMLGALLRLPLQELNVRVAADLAAAGFVDLRPAHFAVFQHLEAGGSRLTDLAARAQVTKQSMGALVDDLERWGYVERVPDPTDGRVRIVRRTARGWAVERVARASVRAFEEKWGQRVGAERMRQFRGMLEEFAATLDEPSPTPIRHPR
jgi:DNA-binding MarR family transcriptional regulator